MALIMIQVQLVIVLNRILTMIMRTIGLIDRDNSNHRDRNRNNHNRNYNHNQNQNQSMNDHKNDNRSHNHSSNGNDSLGRLRQRNGQCFVVLWWWATEFVELVDASVRSLGAGACAQFDPPGGELRLCMAQWRGDADPGLLAASWRAGQKAVRSRCLGAVAWAVDRSAPSAVPPLAALAFTHWRLRIVDATRQQHRCDVHLLSSLLQESTLRLRGGPAPLALGLISWSPFWMCSGDGCKT